MAFFKEYLESLGGKVPELKKEEKKAEEKPHVHGPQCAHGHGHSHGGHAHQHGTHANANANAAAEEAVEEEPEMEVEEKPEPDDQLWDADPAPSQEMGPSVTEVSEDDDSAAMQCFSAGRSALGQRNFEEAIAQFTEAIKKNPTKAVFFATRGEAFLKSKKPNAAIKDCDRALALNPNQAKAYKVRGKARRHIGQYEEAHLDLNAGQKIDFDDDTQEVLSSIGARVEKLLHRKREIERKKAERELNEKKRRVAAARKAQQEAREREERQREEEEEEAFGGGGMPGMGGMGGGMPGMGGMPAGMADAMKDPEVMALLQDPEVMKILTDANLRNQVMGAIANPAGCTDARISALARKVAPLFAKFGGAAGGGGGGANAGAQQPTGANPSFDDEVD